MEGPSYFKRSAVIISGILSVCFVQSIYAEVCYIRNQRTYGGCIKWFLPTGNKSSGTLITLGGYSTTFYRRGKIIEFDQPFVSDESKKGVRTQVGKSNGFPKTKAPSQPFTDEQLLSTNVVQTTRVRSETSAESRSNTQSTRAPSTDQISLSTTVRDITCPSNLTKGELICTGDCDGRTFQRCEDDPYCGCESIGVWKTKAKIVTCGCNDTSSFIPVGFTYSNTTNQCYCDDNGTTVCDTIKECALWETERWTCQLGNQENKKIARLSSSRPSGCHDLYKNGVRDNGIYCVYPKYLSNISEPHMKVYCDMGAWPQGGWTVIQRRSNGSVNFFRNWTDYKEGFGELNHEFWLGNENIYSLTSRNDMKLRIDLQSDSSNVYALYSLFRIDNETNGYKIITLGDFTKSGNGVEDSFRFHENAPFSTYDRDSDLSANENCAETMTGGWWFTNCHTCYLNGVYGLSQSPGIRWYKFPDGQFNIKRTEMKIQPV